MMEPSRAIFFAMPKIELHRHLEGSVRPETLVELCRTHGVELPTYDIAEVASLVRLSEPAADLEGFFRPFRTIKFCFVDREAVARLAYEAVEDASADNIDYMELRFSPEFMAFYHRMSLSDVLDGIVEGVDQARTRFHTVVKLIVSISRHVSSETMNMPWPTPDEIVDVALKYADRGVVGLDLSGKEGGFPPKLFVGPFARARQAGLGITVHAGEDAGPESIRDAIEYLGATRIGHGVRIIQDADVVRLALEQGTVFEVCPTSNVLTRAVESIESHPIREMYDAGLKVTLNSDDPSVCVATLTDEYMLAHRRFGFTLSELVGMNGTARTAAFGVCRRIDAI
jgi:adenosine deaminase